MATSYDINYNDERFTQVETEKQQALSDLEKTYSGLIADSDSYYQAQIDASKTWAEEQKQIQQANTDFAIEQIEQQKEQSQKDYTKEQSGAYTDWQKQNSKYGANAEQMAANGMIGSGYSESSQVSMYNTYQNRVATAKQSYNSAVLNYNNAIKDAQLQNNSALAEIAYEALQQQLALSLQGFQYKNQLLLEQASKKQELENTYYTRYQDVLAQINAENALAEEIRQYNASLAEEKRQFNIANGISSGSSSSSSSSKSSSSKSSSSKSSSSGSKKITKNKTSTKTKAQQTSSALTSALALTSLSGMNSTVKSSNSTKKSSSSSTKKSSSSSTKKSSSSSNSKKKTTTTKKATTSSKKSALSALNWKF